LEEQVEDLVLETEEDRVAAAGAFDLQGASTPVVA